MQSMIETYWVGLEAGRYPLHIGSHLEQADLWRPYLKTQVCLVTDTDIAEHHLARWEQFFQTLGVPQVDTIVLPVGEATKTLESAQYIWDTLLTKSHHRETLLVALGGGVIGDLTGFVASTYLRGVSFVQLPTSLLAQVDAAIGGKCGINHTLGKNLIGSFYQPKAVFLDSVHLTTLPARQYAEGLAEVVKYGLAFDRYFFHWLEAHQANICARVPEDLNTLLKWCCQCKVRVISQDVSDRKERLLLNFGHTLGHAIEAAGAYQDQGYRHGEAVALGMIAASWISYRRGMVSREILERLYRLLEAFSLPTRLFSAIPLEDLESYLKQDKKQTSEGLRWVLLSDLGSCQLVQNIQTVEVQAALEELI